MLMCLSGGGGGGGTLRAVNTRGNPVGVRHSSVGMESQYSVDAGGFYVRGQPGLPREILSED